MYNSKTAKPVYYKLPIKTYAQLEKTIVRLQADTRMCYTTKQQHIKSMFAQYKNNTFII
jgi:hypothetical protein